MGSRFKKTVISESVRKSLSKWQRRVKDKESSSYALLSTATSTASLESMLSGMDKSNPCGLVSEEGSSSGTNKDICFSSSSLDDVSKIQCNAPFPSYEDHDVQYDLSPPPLS